MNTLTKNIIPRKVQLFLFENRYMIKMIYEKQEKKFYNLYIEHPKNSLPIDDVNKWIKKLTKLTYAFPDLIEVGESFFLSDIKILKNREIKPNDIIAICVAKNDILKLTNFIYHHRRIGIDKFIILDNNSTDGSVEWLLTQPDVILMQTTMPYTTNRREGWINRILAFCGDNHWYLVADSDELLVYDNYEKEDIHHLVNYYDEQKITRVRALMLDMYATADYYNNGTKEDYLHECCYFDTTSYIYSTRNYIDLITGGPRSRVFKKSQWLTKYPLFYLSEKVLECKSHFLFPLALNINTECNLILKHYKFLPGELEKIKKIASAGNYFNGSEEYKQYLRILENTNTLDFFYDGTCRYIDSRSLRAINDCYSPVNLNA